MRINSIKSYSSEQPQAAGYLAATAQAGLKNTVSQVTHYNNTLGVLKDSISIGKESILQSKSQEQVLFQSEQVDISNTEEAKKAVRSILYFLKSNGSQINKTIKTSSALIALSEF